MGCHFHLQGNLPDQGSNLHLLRWQDNYFTTELPEGENESEVAQSCLTLWDPTDCSPPGSSIHGILQARRREWVAIPFSRGSSGSRDWTQADRIHADSTIWATREIPYYIYLLYLNCSVMSDSLQLHELQHAKLLCPSPSPRACSNSCPLSRWCHPDISSSIY